MTTYPADAIKAALEAQMLVLDRGADGETALLAAIAAFDAAMLAHGWKRVKVVPTNEAWDQPYDAAPDVKP